MYRSHAEVVTSVPKDTWILLLTISQDATSEINNNGLKSQEQKQKIIYPTTHQKTDKYSGSRRACPNAVQQMMKLFPEYGGM